MGGLGAQPAKLSDLNRKAPTGALPALSRLAGECPPEELESQLKQVDSHKKLLLLQYLKDKISAEEAAPDRKRDKKNKDKKKRKHRHHSHKKDHRRRHRSESSSCERERRRSRQRSSSSSILSEE